MEQYCTVFGQLTPKGQLKRLKKQGINIITLGSNLNIYSVRSTSEFGVKKVFQKIFNCVISKLLLLFRS